LINLDLNLIVPSAVKCALNFPNTYLIILFLLTFLVIINRTEIDVLTSLLHGWKHDFQQYAMLFF